MTTGLEALQRTLAGEHAAVHGYGALGGRAADVDPASFRADLAKAYDVHVARRDDLRRLVTALGADPVAAEPSYRLPPGLTTRAAIAAEALRTEHACLQQYGALVAAVTPGATRRWAVIALGESALTALTFGGAPEPLPGVTVSPSTSPSASTSAPTSTPAS